MASAELRAAVAKPHKHHTPRRDSPAALLHKELSTMTLLDAHLEQISLCAASIAELPFPPPKIFTNALLQSHDITTLIRDTEFHERALFSVPPPPPAPKAQDPSTGSNRRNTTFNINGAGTSIAGGGANAVRAPKRNTAVSAVLGTELVERIRRGGGGGAGTGLGYRTFDGSSNKHEVDVESLLEGAEKLLGVYPIPGAQERIAAMRQRHRRLEASIEHYEYKIAEQTTQLGRLNRSRDYLDNEPEETVIEPEVPVFQPMNEEDLRQEEEEVRQLEQKKRGLEDRVTSMGRDISGLR
ncbi:DASH complex, subunit Spc34 [Amniculicola lignicola CBS 123094]|uniref:DASH complex subunit SPC34 n=1 Tax=Amniculicola lignicola CBS 123094 TaxID=1392246 RepID=A0A6A5X4A8_9PLEO|nr:DASH complex, subunit Spc34 [Amniculicola lignicola CBS 123094]